WRCQRIQRHRAGQRSTARLPFHGQFPATLSIEAPARVLAALAHQSEYLAARLSLHTARRQLRREMEDEPEPHHHDDSGGTVARRKLDLCGFRRNPRRRAFGRTQLVSSSRKELL